MEREKTKFHLTGTKYLKKKFIPTTEIEEIKEEKKEELLEVEGVDVANSLKREAWNAVRTSGGDIRTTDVLNIGEKTRERFGEAGFWSPSDFYKAYTEGNVREVALLAKRIKGKFDTIADLILLAPEAPPDLNKITVSSQLENAYERAVRDNTPDFIDRRKEEIKTYLKKLKIDGRTPLVVSIIDEGEFMTHEKAVEMMVVPEGKGSPAPPVALSKNKIITGMKAIREGSKNAVFERALRDAMTGIQKGKIGTLKEFANFKKTIQQKYPVLQDKKRWKAFQNDYVNVLVKNFENDGIFIKDIDTGKMRPNDEEMARYILKRASGIIGHTNNFKIASLAVPTSASKLDEVGGGELVFQAFGTSKIPIRLTGHMIIEKPSDVDKLVEVLGANPKNGFLPRYFEHVDDEVKALMNTFVVYPRYPPRLTMETPRVSKVEKNGNDYSVTIKRGDTIRKGVMTHLWLKKSEFSTDIVTTIKNNTLNAVARENFDKDYAELTKAEKDSLAIDEDLFPETWGMENEYAGTLCELKPMSEKGYRRLRALESDMESLGEIGAGNVGYEKDAARKIKSEINDLKQTIQGEMNAVLVEKEKKYGETRSAVPNCLLIPDIERNKITIKHGSGSEYVEKKLDKVMRKCESVPRNDQQKCYMDNLTVTQNFTESIDNIVSNAIDGAKTQAERDMEKETKQNLSSIERVIRTGFWRETRDDENRLKEVKPSRSGKRDALNEAKLLGKKPLDTSKWKFLSKM